jgi:hypothetical protein
MQERDDARTSTFLILPTHLAPELKPEFVPLLIQVHNRNHTPLGIATSVSHVNHICKDLLVELKRAIALLNADLRAQLCFQMYWWYD